MVSNNTFVDNHGDTYACISINTNWSSALNLMSSNIFWNNTANQSSYTIGGIPGGSASPVISHSVFDDLNNIAPASSESISATVTEFVFSDDPQFVNESEDNYRLKQGSPYLNIGVKSWVHYGDIITAHDLAGNPRILGASVDIGAYETIPDALTAEYIICNNNPITIDTETEEVPHLWSTGETTQAIIVSTQGDYWVDIGESNDAVRFNFTVSGGDSLVELSGEYNGLQHFECADTLLIVGDCNFNDTLIIDPGTKVIFTGDYIFSTYLVIAVGTDSDSIFFITNADSDTQIGKLNCFIDEPHRYCMPPSPCYRWNSIRSISISGLDSVALSSPQHSYITNCRTVKSFRPSFTSFIKNDSVEIGGFIRNSTISGSNKLIATGFSDDPGRTPTSLYVENSIFTNNNAPLILATAYLTLANNIFQDNNATSGPGAMDITNVLGPVAIYNNTFFGNSGNTAASIGFNHTGITDIQNNIFRNNSSATGLEISIELDPALSSSADVSIRNNSLQYGLSSVSNQPFITFDDNVSYNPEFVDTINYNLRLSETSALIDKGTEVDIPLDFDGNPRRLGVAVNLGAFEYIPKLLRETVYMCEGNTTALNTYTYGIEHLWSTGETTQSITITSPDAYWVEIGEGENAVRFDVDVALGSGSIELSGEYNGTQHFSCVDTLLIVGDCQFNDTLIIDAGTHVIFDGDYELSIYLLYAEGSENDSIYFTSDQSKHSSPIGLLNT